MTAFSLVPFDRHTSPKLEITGDVTRVDQYLNISFRAIGELENILFPEKIDQPQRRDELWRHTCFEFFVAPVGQSNYWEFNLSPSGAWNVYRFQDVRQGMTTEKRVSQLPFELALGEQLVELVIEFDSSWLDLVDKPLDIAITAVIEDKKNALSYWSLKHCDQKPNFHQRECFLVQLS